MCRGIVLHSEIKHCSRESEVFLLSVSQKRHLQIWELTVCIMCKIWLCWPLQGQEGKNHISITLVSRAKLQRAISVHAECFEEEGRMPSGESKLQVEKLQESSTCTLPAGMQIAACSCKYLVGIYEYWAAKTLKKFMGLSWTWNSPGFWRGWGLKCRSLGLPLSAFFFFFFLHM